MTLSAEQLAMRREAIAASEQAAIAGFSPFQHPIDVYVSKVHPERPHQKPEDESPDLKRGRFLERGCAEWYAEEVGAAEVTFPSTLRHPKHPLIVATPDGRVRFDDGRPERSLEIKCPRFHRVGDWCAGDFPRDVSVPVYYLPQVTMQMAVMGLQHCDVAVLLGDELRIMTVDYDQEFAEDLITMSERWYRDHVVARKPPRPDHTEAYASHLFERHPRVIERELLMAPAEDNVDIARALDDANKRLKQAERDKEYCKNVLKDYIGGHLGIDYGPGGKVTWQNDPDRVSVDYQAILADYGIEPNPGDLARHTRTKPGPRVFRISLKGENL